MDTYEKKYNEALKWMRELYPGLHGATKEDAEHYFPELRESKDERIRKWLIDYFSSIKKTVWIHRDITCEQILDWLEKQKEQEHICDSAQFEEGFKTGLEIGLRKQKEQKHAPDDVQKSFEAGQMSIVDNPEQYGLCKKTEWSEEDEKRMDAVIELLENTSAIHPNYSHRKLIIWLKSLRPSWKPSEEQMEALRRAVNKLANTDVADSVRLSIMYDNLKKL